MLSDNQVYLCNQYMDLCELAARLSLAFWDLVNQEVVE